MPTTQTILKDTFGNDTFRPLQREVIENVLARRNPLAVMPTGGGKALCNQIPVLLFNGLKVVISPLIAGGTIPCAKTTRNNSRERAPQKTGTGENRE